MPLPRASGVLVAILFGPRPSRWPTFFRARSTSTACVSKAQDHVAQNATGTEGRSDLIRVGFGDPGRTPGEGFERYFLFSVSRMTLKRSDSA